jgi:hypothetical protein
MSVLQFPVSRRVDPAALDATQQLRHSDFAAANIAKLWGVCSWSEELSDYDRQNIYVYARLLHDESEGAGENDLARDVLGLDPYRNRGRVIQILRAHLKRAHWIADTLFPMLGW